MKTRSSTTNRAAVAAGALALLSAAFTAGQVAPANPAGTAPTVAELFAGELDDVGPQYLLQAKPAAQRFEAWTDWDCTGTSNVTLESVDPVASTFLTAQAGITYRAPAVARSGGELSWATGVRVQTYRYGFLANSNHPVNFIEIDRNNFDLAGAHLETAWRREGWLVGGGLRGAALRSRSTGRRFYEEAVVDAQCLRQWTIAPGTHVAIGIDGARRWTRTDSFSLLPNGWNDRAELGCVVALERQLGPRWKIQPSLRAQGTHYTPANRSRHDRHFFARLTLARALGAVAELRLSLGHEQRVSSDPTINDYRKWDLALGGSLRWRF